MLGKDIYNSLVEQKHSNQSGKPLSPSDRRNQDRIGKSRKIVYVPLSSKLDTRIMKMRSLQKISVRGSVLVSAAQREEIKKYTTFIKLANQWRSETKHMSVMNDIISHVAYKKIIAMGNDVVPMILRELRREPAHWFWALKSITGDNPIKLEDRGRLNKMTEAWLDWGRRNGCRC